MAYLTGVPEQNKSCPQPSYIANNFTDGGTIQSTLQSYALTQPQFPLPPGSNANQIYRNTANVIYFNSLNQQTADIKAKNVAESRQLPYPRFKSESERLMYRQGMATTAARTEVSGKNPAAPMGVPLSTIYQIINNA